MPRQKYYRKLFLIGALWNWIITVFFAFAYEAIFPLFDMPLPIYPAFFMMFLGLAFVFGIGYYWVSQDIGKNHAIVRMGIIGKIFVFIAFVWGWIDGQIPLLLVGAGVVDLVFAILYFEFLLFWRKSGI